MLIIPVSADDKESEVATVTAPVAPPSVFPDDTFTSGAVVFFPARMSMIPPSPTLNVPTLFAAPVITIMLFPDVARASPPVPLLAAAAATRTLPPVKSILPP